MVAGPAPLIVKGCQPIDGNDQADQTDQNQHDGAEKVGHQCDAERRRPIADLHGLDAVSADNSQDQQPHAEEQGRACDIQPALNRYVLPDEQHQYRGDQRNQER